MRAILTITLLVATAFTLTACKSTPTNASKEARVLRHVVCFKFKDSATDEQVQAIVDGFAELPSKIDAIIGFEHGLQNSPEGLDQGYTHVFIVTFKDQAGLEEYLPHPAHKAFVDEVRKVLDPPPFVVDYYTEP